MGFDKVSLIVCLILFVLSSQSFAQQEPVGTCDVPVVVTRYDNALVEDLGPKDFQVQVGADQGTVTSVSIDSGPKWIALLIDASRNVPDDEWKLETEMAVKFIDHARADDRFYFIIVGTDVLPGPVTSARVVRDQLMKLMSSRPGASDQNERIFDSLLASAQQHDPSQFGDVIFLFGHHEDFGSTADPDQVLDLMLKRGLRFFGMSYADPLRGKLPPGFDLNKPLPPGLGPTKLERMAQATGNYFSFHSVQVLNHPGQMQLYEGFLGDLYARIARPYRLRIATPPVPGRIKLEITVSNLQERNIRTSGIYYPPSIYSCASKP
jgi:hypothetical protein